MKIDLVYDIEGKKENVNFASIPGTDDPDKVPEQGRSSYLFFLLLLVNHRGARYTK